MNVFQVCSSLAPRWVKKESLDPAVVVRWRHEIEQSGLDVDCATLTGRIGKEELRQTLRNNQLLLRAFEQALQEESLLAEWPHLLLLTDRRGVLLSVAGPPEVLDNARRIGIERGTRFDLQHAGLNAISMAVRLGKPVYLRGDEHDLRLFKDWSCMCMPIAADSQIHGFLDVSFPCREESPGTELALVEFYMRVLKERLARKCPKRRRIAMDRRFGEYGLSPREREIAYYWALNMGGLQIAALLGITESTVRSVIKNIYRKTGVSDKGQFMRKFLA